MHREKVLCPNRYLLLWVDQCVGKENKKLVNISRMHSRVGCCRCRSSRRQTLTKQEETPLIAGNKTFGFSGHFENASSMDLLPNHFWFPWEVVPFFYPNIPWSYLIRKWSKDALSPSDLPLRCISHKLCWAFVLFRQVWRQKYAGEKLVSIDHGLERNCRSMYVCTLAL